MNHPSNILLMMAQESDFSRYKNMLHEAISPDCSIDWVTDFEAARETLAKNHHDLWLLDCNLNADVISTLTREAITTGSKAALIVLYEEATRDIAMKALQLGASEAVAKQQVTPANIGDIVQRANSRQGFMAQGQNAYEQLEKQNSELGERCATAQAYAGQVSHQIRTPLTVIKAFAAILADGVAGQLNTKQIEHLKKIIDRVDDLSDMLGEMIESSAAEKQKAALASSAQPGLPAPASPPPSLQVEPAAVMTAPPPPAMNDAPTTVAAAPPPPTMEQPAPVVAAPPPPAMGDIEIENTFTPIQATEIIPSLGYSVLIVDDDTTIIEVFSMLIENLGFSVTTATNGHDGLAAFSAVKFDLLILDLGIPGEDGLSIYQKILDMEFAELERTPAILLTGSSDENSISRSANIGAQYVLKDGNAWDNVHGAINEIFGLEQEKEEEVEVEPSNILSSSQVMA